MLNFRVVALGLLSLYSASSEAGTTVNPALITPTYCINQPPGDWGVTPTLNFGGVTVATSATKTLTVANSPCGKKVTITGIGIIRSGVFYPSGKVATPITLPLELAPGQSFNVNIGFHPLQAKSYAGSVTVASSTSSRSTQLAGTGVAVVPTVIIGVPSSLTFNNVTVGESKSLPVTISNTGNSALVVSSLTLPPGFSSSWTAGSIAAGSSQLMNVTFKPTSLQAYAGNLTVNSNKTAGNNQIALQGTGIAPVVVQGNSSMVTTDGQTHIYYYRAPAVATPAGGRPVLIYLHGDGGTGATGIPSYYPFTDPDGALTVTPSGTNKTWSHYAADVAGQAQDSQFLEKIVTQLKTGQFNNQQINTKKIYLAGGSRGAYMPYYLLQRSGTRNQFAAVAINAGLLYCQAGDAECSVDYNTPLHSAVTPIIHVHGTNDTAVAPVPTAFAHSPIDWGQDWRVFNPLNLFAAQNGCFDGSLQTTNAKQFTSLVTSAGKTAVGYDLSPQGAACHKYQLYLVTSGGHVPVGMEKTIWDFLKAYSSP